MKRIQALCTLVCLLLVTSVAIARDLKLGMTGADVRQWQTFLKTRNFDLPADGQFGPVTKRATLLFQRKWNLYADGVVGPQTIRKARRLGFGSTVSSGTAKRSRGIAWNVPSLLQRRSFAEITAILGAPSVDRTLEHGWARWPKNETEVTIYFDDKQGPVRSIDLYFLPQGGRQYPNRASALAAGNLRGTGNVRQGNLFYSVTLHSGGNIGSSVSPRPGQYSSVSVARF